jgi:23S rRNA pseudouridine1911/1915/1917 synthase
MFSLWGVFLRKTNIPITILMTFSFGMGISIFWQNSECCALSKPRFVHSEAGCGVSVAAQLPQILGVSDETEVALLNRLDFETSGILMVSTQKDSLTRWRELYLNHEVEKHYLALTNPIPKIGLNKVVRGYQGSRYRSSAKVSFSVAPKRRFQFAESQIICLDTCKRGSLVLVRTVYGRRHQVRLHCATLGFPLLGDVLYGGGSEFSNGFFLHAFRIKVGDVNLELAPLKEFIETAASIGLTTPLLTNFF